MSDLKNPVDYVNRFFTDKKFMKTVDRNYQTQHWFMLNRFLAKGFPKQANVFNMNKLSPIGGTVSWYNVLKDKFTGTPSFIYAKGKKAKKSVSKEWRPTDEELSFFAQVNQMSKKDVIDAIKMKPVEMKALIEDICKSLK